MKNHPETLTKRMLLSSEMKDGGPKNGKKGSVGLRDGNRNGAVDADELIRRDVSLFDLVNDAIIAKGVDGTITSWNAAAERMFG
jgi:PAS domain-containing protein